MLKWNEKRNDAGKVCGYGAIGAGSKNFRIERQPSSKYLLFVDNARVGKAETLSKQRAVAEELNGTPQTGFAGLTEETPVPKGVTATSAPTDLETSEGEDRSDPTELEIPPGLSLASGMMPVTPQPVPEGDDSPDPIQSNSTNKESPVPCVEVGTTHTTGASDFRVPGDDTSHAATKTVEATLNLLEGEDRSDPEITGCGPGGCEPLKSTTAPGDGQLLLHRSETESVIVYPVSPWPGPSSTTRPDLQVEEPFEETFNRLRFLRDLNNSRSVVADNPRVPVKYVKKQWNKIIKGTKKLEARMRRAGG